MRHAADDAVLRETLRPLLKIFMPASPNSGMFSCVRLPRLAAWHRFVMPAMGMKVRKKSSLTARGRFSSGLEQPDSNRPDPENPGLP
jgi:hypothetical protein